ncbi:Protein disulfide-isomerase-like Protein [Tribolium castaneum]|uniref:Protein disulfide-isomerase-like Protein n=1 Tax=Tribolium castaneum TaxID=7070 RepID=D6WIS6_TRICA|nr:Protein disulfide-isomerase-like Protein [Tribolium castaneum]
MLHPFVSAFGLISSTFSFLGGGKKDEFPTEDGILILNQFNFKEAVSHHELLMVKFYLPWCSHCKAFAPEYLKVCKILEKQQSKIKLGQVDATVEKALVREQEIGGFPALRLFKGGYPITYTGLRKAEHIVAWLNRNSG